MESEGGGRESALSELELAFLYTLHSVVEDHHFIQQTEDEV